MSKPIPAALAAKQTLTFQTVAAALLCPHVETEMIELAYALLLDGVDVQTFGRPFTQTQRLTLSVILNRWSGVTPDADGMYHRLQDLQ